VAIDADTKLVPSFMVGSRGAHTASSRVTVLHVGAITSPLEAVRAAIIQEFRNAETTES